MSQMFAHPLRIAAIVAAIVLGMLAGSLTEQRQKHAAVKTDGWVKAAVAAIDIDEDPSVVQGQDPYADAAFAEVLEHRYIAADEALRAELLSDLPTSEEMKYLAVAANEYLEGKEQRYRTLSIVQEGLPRPTPTDSYEVEELAKLDTQRAALHDALVRAKLPELAARVSVAPGVTAPPPLSGTELEFEFRRFLDLL